MIKICNISINVYWDLIKLKEAIKAYLTSLAKHNIFGPVAQTLEGVKPIKYKWIFL